MQGFHVFALHRSSGHRFQRTHRVGVVVGVEQVRVEAAAHR